MLTIHADSRGRALAVEGARIADAGPLDDLVAAYPHARVREWPGILTPGIVNLYGDELLQEAYHPDPREADELGTEPLTGEALAALALDDARWGASARRGVQRMLAHGTVAVACENLRNRAVRDAVRRSGLVVVGRLGPPGGVPALDPYASGEPVRFAPVRERGSAARFAVFEVRDEAELAERGSGACVATVVDGRLVFRRR
ncbi:imidazolonepropionase-like domain-containing protein [Streptomyces bullii]|uniref:Aminodeoxyfutalosine deaminase/Imidazolonepropionase-like composite domain-containing protein n=1 Tax=Streptomyces bullii TaxID=349910 RepID=A0ABW0UY91_9ACTN